MQEAVSNCRSRTTGCANHPLDLLRLPTENRLAGHAWTYTVVPVQVACSHVVDSGRRGANYEYRTGEQAMRVPCGTDTQTS